MKIEVINNKQKKNKILKYSFCVGAAFVGVLGFNNINVMAAPNDGNNDSYKEDYTVSNAQNNALNSMGFTDFDTVKNHVDFYTPDGKIATDEYIKSVADEGRMQDYLVVKYKDDPTSQKLGQVFGGNGAAAQAYLDRQGSNYTQHLDQLLDIQRQMAQLSGSIVTEQGQSFMSYDPVTGQLTLLEGVDITKVINTGDANKLQELAKLWRDLTGNNDILSMSPEDFEQMISKMDRPEDVNVKITPNKRTYYSITKVRFTITNKNSGSPATNVSVDNATSAQLFSQYNSTWASKFRNATGQSVPSLVKIGPATFEMDFKTPIMSTSNKWKNIIQNWTTDANASNFLGTGAFTITPSSEPLKVKVEVIGDRYVYIEKVDGTGAFAVGKTGQQSSDPTDYSVENIKDSYYYANYDSDVNRSTGNITQSWGKVPNHNIRAKQQTAYNDVLKWEYRIDWSEFPYKYIRDEYGNKKKFYYWERVPYYYYTKEIYDNGSKFKKASDKINSEGTKGDRPLYSVDDGSYVRDIWIRTHFIRYWDYKDEPLTGAEAYPDAPYVVSKFNNSSVKGYHPLVRFNNSTDERKGYVKVKEKSGDWSAPNIIDPDLVLSTTTWNLAPLDGKIQIPVRTQTGQMEGVINGADMNIR